MKRALLFLLVALPGIAADPWKVPHGQWTEDDARRILQSSPWAKRIPGSRATIRWESASPVQFAIEKLAARRSESVCSDCYAIALIGAAEMELKTASDATLKATGRPALSSIGTRMIDDAILFLFPRQEQFREPVVFRLPFGIKVGDHVEFETRIAGRSIKQGFTPSRMTYDGRLEL